MKATFSIVAAEAIVAEAAEAAGVEALIVVEVSEETSPVVVVVVVVMVLSETFTSVVATEGAGVGAAGGRLFGFLARAVDTLTLN